MQVIPDESDENDESSIIVDKDMDSMSAGGINVTNHTATHILSLPLCLENP